MFNKKKSILYVGTVLETYMMLVNLYNSISQSLGEFGKPFNSGSLEIMEGDN